MRTLRLAEHAEGFVALAATFLAYGVAELVEGYGFLAVFVCACTIRAGERTHGYHRVLHHYVEQLERLLTVSSCSCSAAPSPAGARRARLAGRSWLALAFLLVVRPLTGWVGLPGGRTGPGAGGHRVLRRPRRRLAVLPRVRPQHGASPTRAAVGGRGLDVVGSVVLHGVTATPVMRLLDRNRRRAAIRRHGTDDQAPEVAV